MSNRIRNYWAIDLVAYLFAIFGAVFVLLALVSYEVWISRMAFAAAAIACFGLFGILRLMVHVATDVRVATLYLEHLCSLIQDVKSLQAKSIEAQTPQRKVLR